MNMWTNKYSPKNLKEIIGDRPPLLKLQDFILNYPKHKKGAMIVYGPPGTGKTCSVYAIASENNLNVLELNSSDFRNKNKILEIVGDSMNQSRLFNKGRIILIDDMDGFSGTRDRGATQAIASLLEKSSFPIILTSNDPWNKKFSKLRLKSLIVEFKSLSYVEIFNFIKKICKYEHIPVEDKILKKIAIVNEGDLRSAINDLQSLSFGEINEKSLDSLGYREKEESIFNLLQLIFKSKDIDAINEYSNRVYLNLDEVLLWIEENLPIEYSSSELADSFEFLSRADIFRNRIIRRQHWRFLIYQKFLTNLGVALSKTSKKTIFNKYNKPQRILKIWKNKMKYSKKKQIAEKVSENCHLSFKKSMRHYLPYLKYISKNKEYLKSLKIDDQEFIALTY